MNRFELRNEIRCQINFIYLHFDAQNQVHFSHGFTNSMNKDKRQRGVSFNSNESGNSQPTVHRKQLIINGN